jgi:purine-binding chemotaxis protein CheW
MDQPSQSKFNKKLVLDATMRLQLRSMQKKARGQKKGALDWEAVHRRLAASEQADSHKLDQAALLRERTLEIARPLQVNATATAAHPLLVLRCGRLQLALEVEYVREIITLDNLTRVPGVPEFVAGVVNARGKILTLINLDLFLRQSPGETPEGEPQQKQSIIVVESGNFQFGLLCDDFPTIGQYDSTDFNEIGSLGLDYSTSHLTGVSSEGVLFLNLASLVDDPAFLVNQE